MITGAPPPPPSRAPAGRRRLWLFALLPLLQWAISFTAAWRLRTVDTVDTAYYYVIARNLAQGRGLTDTVLWQLLAPPDTVQGPAGSYWEVGWPLVLGGLMRVFGHSQRSAILLCAALSGLVPLAVALVAYLVGGRRGPAFLAGLLVCLQARLLPTNVAPDAAILYQLSCLAGMAAFLWARDRDVAPARLCAVGAALAVPMVVRGEGFLLGATALPLLLFARGRGLLADRRERARRVLWVALGMALFSLPFAVRNAVLFGHLVPESRSLRLWMANYNELYRFETHPSAARFWQQGWPRILGVRRDALVAHLRGLAVQIPWNLLPLGAAGVVARARSPRSWVLPLFVLLSLLVPCLVVPLIANVGRFVVNVLPTVCIAASFGIFAVGDVLARRSRVLRAAAVGAGALASVAIYRGGVSARTYLDALDVYRTTPAVLTDADTLAKLQLAPGDVVVTDDPWRVAAALDVATVMCPLDGYAAILALVEKYRPRLFLVGGNAALKRLVATQTLDVAPVAVFPDRAWYALRGPVRNADGTPRPPRAGDPPPP